MKHSTRKLLPGLAAGLALALAAAGCWHQPSKRIGVSLPSDKTAYYRALRAGLIAAASAQNLDLRVEDADGENARQVAQAQEMVAEKDDALLLVPLNSEAGGRIVLQANGEHVPIFTLENTAGGGALAHIGLEPHAAGRAAAELMLAALPGKGKVAVLVDRQRGDAGSLARAFASALEEQQGVEVLPASQLADPDQAAAKVGDLLAANPDLAGILTTSDGQAEGVIQGLTTAGKNDQVSIVGVGGPDLQMLVKNGTLYGAIIVRPDRLAQEAIATLEKWFHRQTVPNMISVGFEKFTVKRLGAAAPYGAR